MIFILMKLEAQAGRWRKQLILPFLWEGDGFAIYYKWLEKGTYELPLNNNNEKGFSITHEALQYILQAVSLKRQHSKELLRLNFSFTTTNHTFRIIWSK